MRTLARPSATRLVLLDFDGTIADTLDTLIEVYNTVLAPSFKCLPFDGSSRERWRGATAAELLRKFRVPKLKLPLMVLRARREMAQRLPSVKPHPGICAADTTCHGSPVAASRRVLATLNRWASFSSICSKRAI